ncbi:pilus assembly protein [Luteibacter sp. RCC_6_2]|uniref:pilus assembly protein n=1 Tax=Luteibacter sp. RCC_6_2 TaxID=3239223 RepID=UPI003524BBBA
MNVSKRVHHFGSCLALLSLCALAAPMATSEAQTTATYYTTDLSTAPPDLTVAVSPNIAVTFDDSGSMGSSNLPDTLDNSTDKKYYYSSTSNSQYYNPSIKYIPPLQSDGKTRFPDSADFTKVPRDGICATLKTCTPTIVNLEGGLGYDKKGNLLPGQFVYGFYTKTSASASANAYGSSIVNAVAQNQTGAFYYTCPTLNSETGCTIQLLSGKNATAAEKLNFANWYSYYRTRNLMTRSAISNVFSGLGSSIRVVYQNMNSQTYRLAAGTTTFDKFAGTPRDNFFKWLYQVSSSGGTPTRVAIERVGQIFMSGAGVKGNMNPYWEPNVGPDSSGMELTCRLNYSLLVTDGYWNGEDPGVKSPTTRKSITLPDGIEYDNSAAESKIFWNVPSTTYSTLSDLAFYYWATNLRPDFTSGSKFKLDVPPSFVDYTDQNGKPVDWDGTGVPPASLYFNPKNDPATWPHVVQYMIALGINGSLQFDGDYAALRAGKKAWPTPTGSGSGDLTDIDDTWHAAINSRGQYFSARDPDSLANSLSQLLTRIISRSSSAVAGALSSSVLTGNGVTYLTGFDSSNWSGSLIAALIDSNGAIGKTYWSAGDILTARSKAGDSRVILTSTAAGKGAGAAFTWTSASAALKAADPVNFTDTNGADKVAYLRGDTSKEGTTYRRRTSILGAIINSQSVYVAYPASGYTDTFSTGAPEAERDAQGNLLYSYEKFVSDHAKRAPTVYVGANDGMLHAFDATTDATPADSVDVTPSPGKERWAYVPFSIYNKLNYLTPNTDFTMIPTVDATPVTRDVFFSAGTKGWHTILVGGLRLGGRGVYALDITDASASESNANSKVLWEFNNTTVSGGTNVGANLGYTYGKPNIGRLANGKWVVLVPSGYFPSSTLAATQPYKTESANDPASSRTQSSLFVLDAQTGAVIRELVTPTSASGVTGNITSYGLTSPVLGDYNNDQIDDVAFAGDLNGNLWRFDLSDADPAKWAVSLAFYSADQGSRPITVMPRLFSDPTSSYFMVVFGTGKYLGGGDNTVDGSVATQYVYGIRDGGTASAAPVIEGKTKMVEQVMTEVGDIRGLTQKPLPATDADGNSYGGWFIKLYTGSSSAQTDKGERVVVDATALFDSGRAIITTLLPGNTDPCAPVRKGAILVIDAATGGAASGVNVGTAALGAGFAQAGVRVSNVPISGSLPAATGVGGGKIALPGLTIQNADGTTGTFNIGDAVWRRRSWRELNSGQ